MSRRGGKIIFVGNLPGDIREREVEDLFYKYGPIVDIDLKIPPRPPAYAYVEFEDPRDAEDAIRGRDGYKFDGERLRTCPRGLTVKSFASGAVEMAHFGRGGTSARERPSSYSSAPRGRGPIPRRSEYRVLVTGLPSSASWQDLKDHMRRAGDVCFSDVYREGGVMLGFSQREEPNFVLKPFRISAGFQRNCTFGTVGVVDYTNYDDMKYAIKKLDDSEFRNAFSRAYIRVREYDSKRSLSRSKSKSRSRSRSYTRSPSPSSRSRSPRSPAKRSSRRSLSRSVSRSRSRSRSPDASVGKKAGSVSPNGRSPKRDRSVSRSPSPVKSE